MSDDIKYVNISPSEVRSNASLAPSESTISVVSVSAGFEEELLPELYTHHLVDARNTSGAETGEDDEFEDNIACDLVCTEGTSSESSPITESSSEAASNINEEAGAFTLIRCDQEPPVQNAVLIISAPNSRWLIANDWVHAPPCQLNINFR